MPVNPEEYQRYLKSEYADIWITIRSLLSEFGSFVNEDANKKEVWEAHQQFLEHYVMPLYQSLEDTNFPNFLKRVGLTNALTLKQLSNRIFHVVRHVTIKESINDKGKPQISFYKFPIHDNNNTITQLNKVLRDWVSDKLSGGEFPNDLPSWTPKKFQVYLAYETLYIYLHYSQQNLEKQNKIKKFYFYISPFDFYKGLYYQLNKSNLGEQEELLNNEGARLNEVLSNISSIIPFNEGARLNEVLSNTSSLNEGRWTAILNEALKNPMTYLALFSKAIHLSLFVKNEAKSEQKFVKSADNRTKLIKIIRTEITYLESEDEDEILKKVSEGIEIFEKNIQNVILILDNNRQRTLSKKCCQTPVCQFWGKAYCQEIYKLAEQIFPNNLNLQQDIRDLLVKPLSSDQDGHQKIKTLLEDVRLNHQKINNMMILIENATRPAFREIWKKLDNQEIDEND